MRPFFQLTGICLLSSIFLAGCQSWSYSKHPEHQQVTMHAVSASGIGERIGTITLEDSPHGLVMITHLSQLPSGTHGFHIHEKGSCEPAMKDGKMGAALAAGGHFNPLNVAHHGTPLTGHMGDLPILQADSNGDANETLLAPRLKLRDVHGLAIMIHAGGDNYSDTPKPLGGGGARIACGVIP
ncbi:superoxide dismutase family protein [Acinetobacter sp. MB5]|uniref:superoxide dismutase family protein n=1 Tax=Acinetobacter sp. MB5 TaxID=2069438 RepID=UPI000DCFB9F3|nr:superoxide dismutase family protein [Acinetobacter sp. MB5]